jgi:hypothetical protein
MFRTSALNDVTGPGVDKAQEAATEAKIVLQQVLHGEVFSQSIRDMIWAACADYAEARVEILAAKMGEDTRRANQRSFQHDNEMITLLAAPDSLQAIAIRKKNQAELAEITGAT